VAGRCARHRDRHHPHPGGNHPPVGRRLPAFALDVADLTALSKRYRGSPGVVMRRTLWSKLLSTALGTAFLDQDSLFIEHTLLVLTAEVIGHAVVGFDPADPQLRPATLVRGQLFAAAQIRGVVEEDFFDWILEAKRQHAGSSPRPVRLGQGRARRDEGAVRVGYRHRHP